jgi:hypothetical protein
MKIKHAFPKNFRYTKQYYGVQTDYDQLDYWWDETINQWTLEPNWNGGISNTFNKCKSVKAFKRRLYEWSQYLPEGISFRLIGRYVGQDVIGKTKKYKILSRLKNKNYEKNNAKRRIANLS